MDVLGVVAFFISVGLAGLELWRQFFRQARLEARPDWRYSGGVLKGLQVIVFNTGQRKTIVTRVGIKCSDVDPPTLRGDSSIVEQLPVVLDVDEASPKLFFSRDTYMTDGRAEAIVAEDHKRNQTTFDLPPFPSPDDPHP